MFESNAKVDLNQAFAVVERLVTELVERTVEKAVEKVLTKKENEKKPERTYTPTEAAAALRTSKVTLWAMAKRGVLHPIHVGKRKVLYRESEISKLLNNSMRNDRRIDYE